MDGQKDADIPVTERTRVNCVEPLKLTSTEQVPPFAGASQDQTGESERVHMGRHLQTPGASDQNFVLIMMILLCEKTTHT